MINYDEFEQEFLNTFEIKKEKLKTQSDFNNLRIKITLFKALKKLEICSSENEDDKTFMFFGLLSLIVMLINMFSDLSKKQLENETVQSFVSMTDS